MEENKNPIEKGNIWSLLSLISGGLVIFLMLYLELIVGAIIFSIVAIIFGIVGFKTRGNRILSSSGLILGILLLIFLFLSIPSEGRTQARDARIIADMNQLGLIAKDYYDNNYSYTGFEKDSVAVKLKDDIIEMRGINPTVNISPNGNQYCAEVLLNKKGWYCIDGTPISKKYSDNPKCSDDYFACEDVTAHWKTYKNEDFGFEIKYPSEWIIIKEGTEPKVSLEYYVLFADEKETETQREKQAGEIRCSTGIWVYNNEKGLPLYDWAIEKWGEPEKREAGKISEVKTDDLEEIKYEFMSMGIETNILFPQNDKVIDVQTTFDGCDNLHTIFDQMLSTFRFLE